MPNNDITDIYLKAAERSISLNLPFALFAAPGSNDYHFYASKPDDERFNTIDGSITEGPAFFATRFSTPLAFGVMIKASMSAEDVLALPPDTEPWPKAEISAQPTSTSYANYYGQIRSIRQAISRHKIRKAVLSRRISLETDIDPVTLASRYFDSLTDTFRALFFTQETGLWITATPELLLSAKSEDQADDSPLKIETMSLAGTRKPDGNENWDDKNRMEHAAVLDFINDTLAGYGLNPQVHDPVMIPFGRIEHLCHKITAEGHCNIFDLIDELSPTPALAGFPVAKAVKLIGETELHNRHCYGGVIGTIDTEEIHAYVNIRSAMLSPGISKEGVSLVNIFAGGGIMKESVAGREWVEAACKAMPLYSILKPDSADDIMTIPEPWNKIG